MGIRTVIEDKFSLQDIAVSPNVKQPDEPMKWVLGL